MKIKRIYSTETDHSDAHEDTPHDHLHKKKKKKKKQQELIDIKTSNLDFLNSLLTDSIHPWEMDNSKDNEQLEISNKIMESDQGKLNPKKKKLTSEDDIKPVVHTHTNGESPGQYVLKKKKRKLDRDNDGFDASVERYSPDEFEQKKIKKKKKKKRHSESQDENIEIDSFTKRNIVESTDKQTKVKKKKINPDKDYNESIEVDSMVEENTTDISIRKKKKKKKKRESEGSIENEVDAFMVESSVDTDFETKKKKKKKKKHNCSSYDDFQSDLRKVNNWQVDTTPTKLLHDNELLNSEGSFEKNVTELSVRKEKKRRHLSFSDVDDSMSHRKKKKESVGLNENQVETSGEAVSMNEELPKKSKERLSNGLSESSRNNGILGPTDGEIQSKAEQVESPKDFKHVKRRKSVSQSLDAGTVDTDLSSLVNSYFKQELDTSYVSKEAEINVSMNTLKNIKVEMEERARSRSLSDLEDSKRDDIHSIALKYLNVMIPFEVPPQHQIETRMSSVPTKQQYELFNALGVQMKTGPFTKQEDDIIKANWSDFCELHDLEDNPYDFLHLNDGIMRKENRIKFVQFLGRDLHDRKLYSIYRRFQILYTVDEKKGRFTEEEDEIILEEALMNDKNVFSRLAYLLHRSRQSVEKRHRTLRKKEEEDDKRIDKIAWIHKDFIELFVQTLMDVTLCAKIEELKDRKITLDEWKAVAEKLEISHLRARIYWEGSLYAKFFSDEQITTDRIRWDLVNLLDRRNLTDWRRLNWKKMAMEFDGTTAMALYRSFKCFVYLWVPKHLQKDLGACIHYLKENMDELGLKKFLIRRYDFKKGELIKRKISQTSKK